MTDNRLSQGEGYHVRLQPEERGFHLKLGEVWAYRDLVLLLTKKTFSVSYQQTVMGPLWILVQPVLSSLMYLIVFGRIANIGTGGVPQVLFYFVSTAVWGLLSMSLVINSNVFASNAHLFSKVYFPRVSVPISNILVNLLRFCVQLILVAVLMAVYAIRGQIQPHWAWYPLLPLLYLQMSILGMSVGLLLSSLTTKYRDLLLLVDIGASLWMYGSPVVYPLGSLSEGLLKSVIRINPATEIMELIRWIMLGEGEFDPRYYCLGLAVTLALFLLSLGVFNRVERTFADTI